MSSLSHRLDRFLRHVDDDDEPRWHAQLAVGVIAVVLVGALVLLAAPGPSGDPGVVPIVAGTAVAAAIGLEWIRRTGHWRGATAAILGLVAGLIGLLGVREGVHEPSLVAGAFGIIATGTFVLGSRWAWPLYALCAGFFCVLLLSAAPSGPAFFPAAERAVGLTVALALPVAMCWLVERRRKTAFDGAKDRFDAEQATQAALQLSDAKSAFLAMVSHDIRTPMNGVLNMQRLLRDTRLSAEQRHMLDIALGSSEATLELLDDLLDFSKLEAGRLELEPQPFDLPALLDELTCLHRAGAEARGLQFLLRTDSRLPRFVLGDSGRVRQILNNLLSNAVKFTAHGTVTLRATWRAQAVHLAVEDTGIGIETSALTRIFDPFTQGERSTTRRFGGTGLGLTITRTLCQMMGGDLDATSVVNKGSVFEARLPLPRAQAPRTTPLSAAKQAGPLRLRVLVAEDDRTNQHVARHLLERLGARVVLVHDGAAAVALAGTEAFDLVLMDLHMPVMDGIEATQQIRALEGERWRTPIVGVTASALDEVRARCLEAGMNDHVAKPIRPDDLAAVLARWGDVGQRARAATRGLTSRPAESSRDESPMRAAVSLG